MTRSHSLGCRLTAGLTLVTMVVTGCGSGAASDPAGAPPGYTAIALEIAAPNGDLLAGLAEIDGDHLVIDIEGQAVDVMLPDDPATLADQLVIEATGQPAQIVDLTNDEMTVRVPGQGDYQVRWQEDPSSGTSHAGRYGTVEGPILQYIAAIGISAAIQYSLCYTAAWLGCRPRGIKSWSLLSTKTGLCS